MELKKNSLVPKLRTVFNNSARDFNKISLNDLLHTGCQFTTRSGRTLTALDDLSLCVCLGHPGDAQADIDTH